MKEKIIQIENKKNRDSNIELLRIIHYMYLYRFNASIFTTKNTISY